MNQLKNIISFYKDCYLQDYKAIKVYNFFDRKAEFQLTLDSFEAISGELYDFPIDSEWGQLVDEDLVINSKEKALYAGVFFLKGNMPLLGKPRKIFTPLYLYEVKLNIDDGIYSIELDLEDPIINPAFLEFMKYSNPDMEITYDQFASSFPQGKLNFDNIILIEKKLKAFFPNLNVTALNDLLEKESLEDLKHIFNARKAFNQTILVGAALGLFKKPKGSRGVLNELDSLAQKEIGTGVLKEMFFAVRNTKKIQPVKPRVNIPVSLSESQQQVFTSLRENNKTLVIGAPGTGKSFTIAALSADLISKGKSVLIASKNNQAGKVVSNKIENDLGLKGLVIKTSSKRYKSILIRRLNDILIGIDIKKINERQLKKLDSSIANINNKIDNLVNQIKKREVEEIKWGRFLHNFSGGFISNIKRKWVFYQHRRRPHIWTLKSEIDRLEKIRIEQTKKYIKDNYDSLLYKNLSRKREQVINLVKALEKEAGNLIQQEFEKIDFKTLLKALPAWVCNTSDIHNVMPLREGLFDVVIIDEATQCDIASTIPLLYRAKKVVIVGDPKQLRHISFLSKANESNLRIKYQLDEEVMSYRSNSILDLINASISSQNHVVFLDEHYRSSPDIIQFSNSKFYSDNLNVMTTSPIVNERRHIFLEEVGGERDSKGVNVLEGNMIMAKIAFLIEEEKKLNGNLQQSIGIISPFRAQVTHLKKIVKEHLSLAEIKRHKILIGTPFHFQGEERDVIFLSFVIDDNSHPSSFIYLNRADVFNVSITRARSKQFVYSSVNYKNLNKKHLLTQYLSSIDSGTSKLLENVQHEDQFADEVVGYIETISGVTQVLKNYPVAGVDIDIVVVKDNKTYCIDLIGYPGAFEKQFTQVKIKMLDRMNHYVFFLTYSNWHLDREACEKMVQQFFDS